MLALTDRANEYGGKAARLLELQAAGFRVPEFVISPDDLHAAVRQLGLPLAVRSSANVEDGDQCSMAGQFRSVLNLRSLDEVQRAIEQCRASADSDAVRSYCRSREIEPASVRMDVIVQRMLEPELSGVAFTVNPMTGAEDIVIEACAGLSDDMLSGRIAPLPSSDPRLSKYRSLIEDLARRIQRHFGAPQDIEFAIERGVLYVLQSRPITRIEFSPDVGQWTTADFRDGGVSSTVCTPLMWSLYDLVWERTLKGSLRELHLFDTDFLAGRMFFGRPYWNLGAVKNCLAKLPGFVERPFDEDLSVPPTYEGDGRRTPVTFLRVVRALPTLLATGRFLKQQVRVCKRLLDKEFDDRFRRYDPTRSEVLDEFRDLIERDFFYVESAYFRTIFAASLAKMDFKSSFPDVACAELTAGLPPLRHLAPVRRVQSIPSRTDAALDSLIDEFRHHCRRGLDICHPRWDEDRPFVRSMLRSLTSTPGELQTAPENSASPMLSRQTGRKFARKLAALRHYVWLREEMRDLSMQMYWLIRRYVLSIAQQQGWGDDVFFMTYQEILAGDASQVEARREVYESYRNFKAPNEIGRACRAVPATTPGTLSGLGAGPGTAQGPAYIARTVEQAMAMPPRSVLVCPFIDPGWTPVLDRAAAVVAETGGLLSHAAVICREYGLPAVLAVEGATERIRLGSWLTVHGSEGQVEISRSEQ